MGETVQYWHGGQRGLRKGDLVKPTMLTGAKGTRPYGTAHVCRADRVYVTTIRRAALIYAVLHPSRGFVYRVQPIGPLEPDPDYIGPDEASWQCEFARVLEVCRPTPEEQRAVYDVFDLRPPRRGKEIPLARMLER